MSSLLSISMHRIEFMQVSLSISDEHNVSQKYKTQFASFFRTNTSDRYAPQSLSLFAPDNFTRLLFIGFENFIIRFVYIL